MSSKSKHELWQQRLAAYSVSGLSQTGYCRQLGLPLHQFKYWQRKLATTDAEIVETQVPAWCAVQLAQDNQAAPSGDGITICVGAARIELSPGFNASLLRQVVRALEAGPC